jgi:hypothetical protein
VFGVLRAARNEEIILTLAGGLDTTAHKLTILGEAQDGRPITLTRCIPKGTKGVGAFTHRLGEVESQEFLAHEALFGGRYAAGDQARFRFTEVTYEHLPEWIGESTIGTLDPDVDGYERSIGIRKGKESVVHYGDTEIRFATGTTQSFSPGNVTLRSEGRLYLFSRRALTLKEWHQEFLTPIGYLMTLALGKGCTVTDQSVLERAPWWTYVKKGKRPPTVTVQRGKRLETSNRLHGGPFFSLSQDGIVFEDVLSSWLSAWAVLKLPMDLYFDAVYGRFSYLETSFLSLVQAAEGYHRVRCPQLVVERDVHEARLASIYEAIPEREDREWLQRQLGEWSNERRLRQRLRDLLQVATSNGFSMPPSDAKRFVDQVKTNRDILSHGGLEGRQRCSSEELFALEQQLGRMLHACFVGELGVSAEVARRIGGGAL